MLHYVNEDKIHIPEGFELEQLLILQNVSFKVEIWLNYQYLLKIQQVNLHDPPGKVAVTCSELQYHSNLHKNHSKN